MDYKLVLGVVTGVLAVVLFVPYYRDIFLKKTQPHAYSWLVWAILQGVGVAAQFKDGAGYGAWGLTVGAFFCFGIFVLSFRYGTRNITTFDGVCLAASLMAIALYFFIENPLWALVCVAIVDFVGFLPTFRKGFAEPWTETNSTFVLSALSSILSLCALQNYTFTTVFYIASLFFTNSSFATMIIVRRKVLAHERHERPAVAD
jgi:hypothetical protein